MFLEGLGDGDEAPDEHAGVPAVVSAIEVFDSFIQVGFFDEAFDFMEAGFGFFGSGGWGQVFSEFDIAVAGGGFGGFDTDGDHGLAAAGEVEAIAESLLELFFVGDDVVGGEDGHDTGGGAAADECGAEGDGGGGIAAHGFGDEVFAGDFGELFLDFLELGLVGDDEDILGWDEGEDAIDGLLEEGFFTEEAYELFGGGFAADGPEAFAASAGHDNDEAVLIGGRGGFFPGGGLFFCGGGLLGFGFHGGGVTGI